MMTVDKPGRVRSPMWTAGTIAQIYQDKTIHVGVGVWGTHVMSRVRRAVHKVQAVRKAKEGRPAAMAFCLHLQGLRHHLQAG